MAQRLIGDTAYDSTPMLEWIVNTKRIVPLATVQGKAARQNGTSARPVFTRQALLP